METSPNATEVHIVCLPESAGSALYGMVDDPGYLELGLCPNFGEGTAEVIEEFVTGRKKLADLTTVELSSGDIERAVVEWLSLLRHVVHARELDRRLEHDVRAVEVVEGGLQAVVGERAERVLSAPVLQAEVRHLRQPVVGQVPVLVPGRVLMSSSASSGPS